MEPKEEAIINNRGKSLKCFLEIFAQIKGEETVFSWDGWLIISYESYIFGIIDTLYYLFCGSYTRLFPITNRKDINSLEMV